MHTLAPLATRFRDNLARNLRKVGLKRTELFQLAEILSVTHPLASVWTCIFTRMGTEGGIATGELLSHAVIDLEGTGERGDADLARLNNLVA
jgi:hypothetical protein